MVLNLLWEASLSIDISPRLKFVELFDDELFTVKNHSLFQIVYGVNSISNNPGSCLSSLSFYVSW